MKKVYLLMNLTVFLFFVNQLSVAQTTHTWINGTGNWSDSTHWNTGMIPSPMDNVIIPYDPNDTSYTVTLDTNATIAHISIGGESGVQTLKMSNKTFTINVGGIINGKGMLLSDSSTINSNGVLINEGELSLTNSIFEGNGTGLLSNEDTMYVEESNLVLKFDNNGFASFTGNCLVYNYSAADTNSGTIVLNNSDLTLEQEGFEPSFTSTGILTIDITSTLRIEGGTFNYLSGTFNLNGNLYAIDDATVHFTPSFSNYSTINLDNSTFTSDSTFTNLNMLRLTNSFFDGTGSIINEDSIFVEGICNINNTLNIGPSSTIQLYSQNNLASYLKVASGFTNHGKIEFIGSADYFRGTLEVTDNTPLINGLDGIIQVSSTGNTMFKDRIFAKLNNQGTITLNNSLEIKKESVDHINSGTIKVIEGELTLTQITNGSSFLNAGELVVYVNNTLNVNGGSFNHNSGIFSLYGTLLASAYADLYIVPPFTNEGTIFLNSSTLNLGDSLINYGEMTFTNSKLTGNGTLSNYWNLKVINSSVDLSLNNNGFAYFTGRDSINSNIFNQENSTIQLSSIYNSNCNLTVASNFENFGTIEFETLYFNVFGILTVNNGKLINNFSGDIISTSGPQYANRIHAELENNGELSVEDSLVISKTLAHHINSSKIDLKFGGVIKFIGESFINESSGTLAGEGTLSVGDVSFINYGKISPGIEPGITAVLNIHGDLYLENSSEIYIELGRSAYGRINDRVNVTDSAALDGILNIILINKPAVGDTFEVMTFSGYTAAFDSISGLTDTSVTLIPEFTQNSLILICTSSNNLSPIAVDDSFVVVIDSTSILDVLANDSDPNGDPLNIVSISGPSNGTANIMLGDTLISYTPQAGYTGLDSLDYVITDGYFYDTAKVSINVSLMRITKLSSLNLSITDFQTTTSNIHINLPGNQSQYDLVKVEVLIDTIFHSATGDLQFILKHNAFIDTLINQVGAYGDNFINTKLSDESLINISQGIPPFTGIYKPYNSLNVFTHLDPNEDWTLEIYDGKIGNQGILLSWGLIVYYENVTLIDPYIYDVPTNYNLGYNYPNPFNPTTTIQYSIKERTLVELALYDILGKQVDVLVKEEQDAGYYIINFNAGSLASGVYFYQLKAGAFVETKKMVLMK